MAVAHPAKVALCLIFLLSAVTANAQDLRQQFVGAWYSFDPSVSTSGSAPCALALHPQLHNPQAASGPMRAQSQNCQGALAKLSGWLIQEGQIHLLDTQANATLFRIGGTPLRLTGAGAQAPDYVILERPSDAGRAQKIAASIKTYRCLFSGYGTTCATAKETQIPSNAGSGAGEITTLVDLNVRAHPRDDAAIVGVLPTGAEIKTVSCLPASDGLWCGAQFGDHMGWFARTALRQDTWPVLTFRFKQDTS